MDVKEFYKNIAATPIQYLTTINNIHLWIKRDDLNDELIQGNKLRKLKYSLLKAQQENKIIISFGGAYSNHIAALAAAGKRFGIATIGVIRGEELNDETKHSHTLQEAKVNGMQLFFVSRQEYRLKEQGDAVRKLVGNNDKILIVPEGGSNQLALLGASEIVDEIVNEQLHNILATKGAKGGQYFDRLFCACGTGGTLAGILKGIAKHTLPTKVYGVPVLKGGGFLYDDIKRLNPSAKKCNWELIIDAHCGGYAKKSSELLQFMQEFEEKFTVLLDPIYTGKLCKSVFKLASDGNANQEENWLIYHSGGLQGR